MSGAASLARQLAQRLVSALAFNLFVREVRHDLPHLHRLTGWHFLNADDNLVIGRSRRGLKQFPKTLNQFPLIFRCPPCRIKSVSAAVAEGSPAVNPQPGA